VPGEAVVGRGARRWKDSIDQRRYAVGVTTQTPRSGWRASRLLSPTGFAAAGLLLFLPFVAVSCEAPGGFGRAAPGGTTTYHGVDLITGGAPTVAAEQLAPIAAQRDDVLPPQPLAIAVAALIIAGLIATIVLRRPASRRAVASLLAAMALIFVFANQTTVHTLLQSRLREQLTVALPPGRSAADFVQNQSGFWLCASMLGLLAVANALGWLRANRAGAQLDGAPRVAVPTQPTQHVADSPPVDA
jgi:hypothetical protein